MFQNFKKLKLFKLAAEMIDIQVGGSKRSGKDAAYLQEKMIAEKMINTHSYKCLSEEVARAADFVK